MKRVFTLVELMIVVAIISILAAIAIPNFVAMQLRSKRAEIPLNVDGIEKALLSYLASYDTHAACGNAPSGPGGIGKQKQAWAGANADCYTATLEWRPDGDVYGYYGTQVLPSMQSYQMGSGVPCKSRAGKAGAVIIMSGTDVDGDSIPAYYMSISPLEDGNDYVGFCQGNDVY